MQNRRDILNLTKPHVVRPLLLYTELFTYDPRKVY